MSGEACFHSFHRNRRYSGLVASTGLSAAVLEGDERAVGVAVFVALSVGEPVGAPGVVWQGRPVAEVGFEPVGPVLSALSEPYAVAVSVAVVALLVYQSHLLLLPVSGRCEPGCSPVRPPYPSPCDLEVALGWGIGGQRTPGEHLGKMPFGTLSRQYYSGLVVHPKPGKFA